MTIELKISCQETVMSKNNNMVANKENMQSIDDTKISISRKKRNHKKHILLDKQHASLENPQSKLVKMCEPGELLVKSRYQLLCKSCVNEGGKLTTSTEN